MHNLSVGSSQSCNRSLIDCLKLFIKLPILSFIAFYNFQVHLREDVRVVFQGQTFGFCLSFPPIRQSNSNLGCDALL